MTTAKIYEHLIILETASPRLLKTIARRDRQAKSILLEPSGATDLLAMGAAELARETISEDSILKRVVANICAGAKALSNLDAELARIAADASKGNAFRSPVAQDEDCFSVENGPVLFCPYNDTHVSMFDPIAQRLSESKFLHFELEQIEERTEQTLENMCIDYVRGGPEALSEIKPSVVVFGNDWNLKARAILKKAQSMRIPTVCIQEGCLNFGDQQRRMQWCDYPLVQGPIMPKYLEHQGYFFTGNPRLDRLKPAPSPSTPRVMINCNFTYDVHEDIRDSWVRSAAEACEFAGVEYFVSKHPRDIGRFPDLHVRNSGFEKVHDHLSECSVLLTRFSTLVYEALALGRKVIYYNPHGETMRLFSEDRTGGILRVQNRSGLGAALEYVLSGDDEADEERRRIFLARHCGPLDGRAAYRCAAVLAHLSRVAYPMDTFSIP